MDRAARPALPAGRRPALSAAPAIPLSREGEPRRPTRRAVLRAGKVLLGLALLALLVHFVDVEQTLRILGGTDPAPLAGAVALAAVAFLVSVERWRLLLAGQGISLPLRTLSGILLVGMFFNTFLPGGTLGADVIRVHEVGRRSAQFVASASSVLVDRLVGLFALLSLGCAGALLGWGTLVTPAIALVTVALWAACLALLTALASSRVLAAGVRALSAVGLGGRRRGRVEEASVALRRYLEDPAALWKLLALSLVYHLIRIGYFFAIAVALGMGASFLQIAVIVPIVGVLQQAPFTVSGLGVREGAFVYFFGLLGVPAAVALAFSILERLLSLLHSLAGGLVYVLRK